MSIPEHSHTLTWLHLSDLHLCNVKTGWDANRVLKGLIPDMQKLEKMHGLTPDLLFFTGDAVFGQLGSKPGEKISDQFDEMEELFNGVRKAFSQQIPKTNVFLVPGNHDVNRNHAHLENTHWLGNTATLTPTTKVVNLQFLKN